MKTRLSTHLYHLSIFKTNTKTLISEIFTFTSELEDISNVSDLIQGWFKISQTVSLLRGRILNMFLIRSLHSKKL